ncbi:MAG TPA: FxsA family protein [Burkholderiales bacterium]|jgi:UPF0716 protein FxsA|nr:FxsA family protein [Burkholderiales bacterium]
MLRIFWIVLLLPLVDLLLTAFLLGHYGTPFLLWLLVTALAGMLLIGLAKSGLRATLMALQSGNAQVAGGSLWRILASARAFFAGALLLFPGVLSDLLALVVLLLPARLVNAAAAAPRAANDDVIEAEFHEVREVRPAIDDGRTPRP